MAPTAVFLEVGAKRAFAGALEWPGWCRSGRDEEAALAALVAYGPRYAAVVAGTDVSFAAPSEAGALLVVERLAGNATTDFGAPGLEPSADAAPMGTADLARTKALLRACWAALDRAVAAAAGKPLRTGPRGGGRDVAAIVEHVRGAEDGYLSRLGSRAPDVAGLQPAAALEATHQAVLEAIEAMAAGVVPAEGPRGGRRWSARYGARRVAWHVLDHAWEIEDRLTA